MENTKNVIYKDPQDYPDQYAIEMYKAMDTLESIDTVESLYDYNLQSKLRMINKINSDYGKLSKGIENYCRIQSLEADENNAPAPTNNDNQNNNTSDNNNQNNNNNSNNPDDQKKRLHLKDIIEKVHNAVMSVISKIFDWIVNLINKFRYNNKVFETTINTINNATPEEINKISDDLKTVEIDAKNLIDVSKHPQQNINKYINTYKTICSVFENAVNSASTNPSDITRLKDFATKLYEFVKSIPDVGSTCPQLQGDGAEGLKQYYTSLKTYCSSTLNYQKMAKSFNKYFGGADTLEGKITPSKIVNSSDPKAIITIIKTESDEIGKLSEELKNINNTNKSAGKKITDLLKKMLTQSDKSKAFAAQVETLIACERALAQLNSVFSGICANSIKSLNTVKGKLIDFTKKNVKAKDNKNEENKSNDKNVENNKEENTNNEETKEDWIPQFKMDYGFNSYINSLEHAINLKFTDIYLVDETESYSSEAMDSDNPIVRGFSTLLNLFRNIWRSIVRLVKLLFHKISEAIQRARVNKAAKKSPDNKIAQFLQKAQRCMDKMDPIVNKIEKNVVLFEEGIKTANTKDDAIAVNTSRIITVQLKVFILFEKIIFKAFSEFRKQVLGGKLFILKEGKIESFTNKFCDIGNYYCNFLNKAKDQLKASNSNKTNVTFDADKFNDIYLKSMTLIYETIGSNKVSATISKYSNNKLTTDEHQNKEVLNSIKQTLTEIDEILSNQETIKYISNYLFGTDPNVGEDRLISDDNEANMIVTNAHNEVVDEFQKINERTDRANKETENSLKNHRDRLNEHKVKASDLLKSNNYQEDFDKMMNDPNSTLVF